MKKVSKLIVVLLVLAMALTGCEKKVPPMEKDDRLAAEAYPTDKTLFDIDKYVEESAAIYTSTVGEFSTLYEAAKQATNLSERWALMALAEGKLLGAGILLPLDTQGGNYAITRVVPRSGSTILYGNDTDRFDTVLVATEFLTPALRDEVKAKWAELRGTGTFLSWAKSYLEGKGYTFKSDYNVAYGTDPQTWDLANTYRSADTEKIWPTSEGLFYYDAENIQQPGLALSVSQSEDGLKYTFTLRQGVKWVDSQGREVGEMTADDFVAGFQHLLDAEGGLESLVTGDACNVKGAAAYLNGEDPDFSHVGVKAVDTYTLEYELAEPCGFFLTMLSYNMFAPLNRAYYESQGGVFGKANYDYNADSYKYGKSKDNIAYVGPFIVKSFIAENSIIYEKNPSYWNAAAVSLDTVTWKYNDGSDSLKAYNDAKAGVTDGSGLNAEAVEAAKKDGLFDKHAYLTDTNAVTYCGFLNVNRKAYANYNDNTKGVSTKTVYDAKRSTLAMQNVHFRRAICASIDRGAREAQSVGEELKLVSIRNMYTPGNFVSLPEEVTVKVNGKDTTFPAGTFYGAITQAQLDADGVKFKVWDEKEATSDGFDGWYNPEYAKAELAIAVKELAQLGVVIDAENPIILDNIYPSISTTRTNTANVTKKSIEEATGGFVEYRLNGVADQMEWLNSGYYPDNGYDMNADFTDLSGWGPDYGDPQTYLDTMLGNAGGMIKSCGIY